MYSVNGFGDMIADTVRMAAYEQALRRAVKPNAVVLDIGTGTGILAMLACQFGARKVYAVEPDSVIELARQGAAANGYLDRVEFIEDFSTRITLPERADVIVSDLNGVLPLFQHHIPSIIDARRRHLAPGGTLIPQCAVVKVAVVEAPERYSRHMGPWDSKPYGLDMQAARDIVSNTWRRVRLTPEHLILQPQAWASLDYRTIENPMAGGTLTWMATRAGTGHGLIAWFDTTLMDGIGFSNAPSEPDTIYGGAFFPWSAPVPIAVGDSVTVALHADLIGDDYIWRWDTVVLNQAQPGEEKAHFKQSTFFGAPLSPASLRKRAAGYVPTMNEDGQIDQFILEMMDGQATLGDIAQRAFDQFPSRFADPQDALTRVGTLAQRYSL